MNLHSKLLSGLAALALFAYTAPASFADDMSADDQETLIPSEEPTSEEWETGESETQETVLPADEPADEFESEPEVSEDVVTEEDLYGDDVDSEVQEEVVPEGRETIIVAQPRGAAQPLDNIILELGGGASTFTQDLGDALEGGAGYTGRAVWGARNPLGVELAYFGAVNPIEGAGADDIFDVGEIDTDTSVFTNSAEALARINFLGARSAVKPFLAGGANYTRFDSDTLLDGTEVFAIPVAAGLQFFPLDNFTIGARGEYRFLTEWIDDVPDGDQWGGTLTVGANF
jgi:hypothetical protein